MVDFEPPKRKALSDAELHRAITLLGSSAEGIANSERLIFEQAALREQDAEALGLWIAALQKDGSPEALLALNKLALEALPANIEQIDAAPAIDPAKPEIAIFTTEIPIVGRRERAKRNRVLRGLLPGLASWLLVALVNSLIVAWLELSILEAVFAIGFGSIAAGIALGLIKSHSLHPLIRSAAVFGGWGVYLGAAIALCFTSLVILEGVVHIVENDLNIALIPGYRTDVLACGIAALVIGQILPRSWPWTVLLSGGLLAAATLFVLGEQIDIQPEFFAYAPLSGDLYLPQPLDWEQVGWASFAVALMTIVILAFALPHSPTKAWSFALQAPLGVGLSVTLLFLGQSDFVFIWTLFVVFMSMAFSGRDLTSRPIGRWAGAAFILPVLLMPILDFVSGAAVSVLSALIVLLFSDQLFRRTPLHIPSLDTSYGFYGSFQPLTWICLALAVPFGVPQLQDLLLPNSHVSTHELALIFGLLIGVVFAILRIFPIRAQDREIRNVEIRNMNLDNLLGL